MLTLFGLRSGIMARGAVSSTALCSRLYLPHAIQLRLGRARRLTTTPSLRANPAKREHANNRHPRTAATASHAPATADASLIDDLPPSVVAMRLFEMGRKQMLSPDEIRRFGLLVGAARSTLRAMETSDLVKTIWAIAKHTRLRLQVLDVVAGVFERLVGQLNKLSPIETSQLVWAMAKVGRKDFLDSPEVARHISSMLSRFDERGLSNIAYTIACHLSGKNSTSAFSALSDYSSTRKKEGKTRNEESEKALRSTMRSISSILVKKGRKLNPQDLANTAWAYAT